MSANEVTLKPEAKKNQKWLVAVLLLIPFVISFFQLRMLDNDFYFLYTTGEYITKRGFPFTDILSMHSSMKIIVQQWLSAVIFYYVYSVFGKYGIFALLYICYAGIILLVYRYTKLTTDRPVMSAIFTAVVSYMVFDAYMVTRPQMFTYVILLAEVCLLEQHVKTKSNKCLYAIPLLSLALVNLHGAMWAMLLVFMLPYLVSSVSIVTKSFKLEGQGNLLALLAVFGISIAAGLLNPYSWETMIYLTSSYGQKSLALISEMSPTSLSSAEGKTYFIAVGLACLVVCFIRKRQFARRSFLLFSGSLLLALLQIKGIPYFFLFGVPAFTYTLKDLDITKLNKYLKDYNKKSIKILVGIFAAICLIYICEARYFTTRDINISKEAHFKRLDEIIAILDQSSEEVVLYTNFNDGQYLEMHGYHPYIDGRAELFLYKNNKEYDYFDEYGSLMKGSIYYRDFTDKYQFNYLILSKGPDCNLFYSLLHDEDFELTYIDADVILFHRK